MEHKRTATEILNFISSSHTYQQWRDYFVRDENWADTIPIEVLNFMIQNKAIHYSFVPEFISCIYHRLSFEDLSYIILKWDYQFLYQFSTVCVSSENIIELYVERGKSKLSNYSLTGSFNNSFTHLLNNIYSQKKDISQSHLDFFFNYPGELTQAAASKILLYGTAKKYLSDSYLYQGLNKSSQVSSLFIEFLLDNYQDSYYIILLPSIEKGASSNRKNIQSLFLEFKIKLLKKKIEIQLKEKETSGVRKI